LIRAAAALKFGPFPLSIHHRGAVCLSLRVRVCFRQAARCAKALRTSGKGSFASVLRTSFLLEAQFTGCCRICFFAPLLGALLSMLEARSLWLFLSPR
jgi:hypothetical protein